MITVTKFKQIEEDLFEVHLTDGTRTKAMSFTVTHEDDPEMPGFQLRKITGDERFRAQFDGSNIVLKPLFDELSDFYETDYFNTSTVKIEGELRD